MSAGSSILSLSAPKEARASLPHFDNASRNCVAVGRRDERGGSEQPERGSGGAGVEKVNRRGVGGDAAGGDGDDGTVRHEPRRRVHQREDHQALSSLALAGDRRHVVPVRQESGGSPSPEPPSPAVKCRYPGFISAAPPPARPPFLAPRFCDDLITVREEVPKYHWDMFRCAIVYLLHS